MKNKQAPPTPAHTGRGLQGFKGGKGWFFRGAKLYIRYIPLYAIYPYTLYRINTMYICVYICIYPPLPPIPGIPRA